MVFLIILPETQNCHCHFQLCLPKTNVVNSAATRYSTLMTKSFIEVQRHI